MRNVLQKITNRISFLVIFLLFTFIASAQTVISGQITDSKSGSGLAGVTVSVKGTRVAVQTDAQGNYSINAPAHATLVATSASYGRKELVAAGQTGINFSLAANNQQLNEVVVVAYGTRRKSD